MIIEYVEEALRRARYEIIDDKEPYYGEIDELRGVWATGKTLEECRNNLKEVIDRCFWPLLKLATEDKVPLAIESPAYTLEVIAGLEPSHKMST